MNKSIINHRGGRALLLTAAVVTAVVGSSVSIYANNNTDQTLNLSGSTTVTPSLWLPASSLKPCTPAGPFR